MQHILSSLIGVACNMFGPGNTMLPWFLRQRVNGKHLLNSQATGWAQQDENQKEKPRTEAQEKAWATWTAVSSGEKKAVREGNQQRKAFK